MLVWGCGGVERDVERDVERGVERGVECDVERGVERGVECDVERGVELGVERVDTDLLPLSLRGDWLLGDVLIKTLASLRVGRRDDSGLPERRALAFGTSGSCKNGMAAYGASRSAHQAVTLSNSDGALGQATDSVCTTGA